jgi:hypothetical protein
MAKKEKTKSGHGRQLAVVGVVLTMGALVMNRKRMKKS